jgi:RHS repeat protein
MGYSGNGDVTSANDSVTGNWTYSYDAMNRLLTSSKSGQGFSYVYDRFGNRWQQNVTAGSGPNPQYSFDANNRIVGGSYDAAGNLLNDGMHTYTYDAENRISKVDGGNTATFTYDAEGRRAGKNTFTYLYDLAGHAVAELNGGTWDRGEVYAAGRHLATYAAHGQLPAPWFVALKSQGAHPKKTVCWLLLTGSLFGGAAEIPP